MGFALYLDEDTLHRQVVRGLRAGGVDLLTTHEARRSSAEDSDQLAFAAASGRAILTTNRRDFARLHAEWSEAGQHHAGVIIVTDQRTPPGRIVSAVLALQIDRSPAHMRDALLFIGNR